MWFPVAKASEIEEGKGQTVQVQSQWVALFKAGGQVYALDNTCPHRGGPLGEGHVEGGEVTCPWHAWTFDLKFGECSSMPGVKQKTYKVKIEDGEVFVEL